MKTVALVILRKMVSSSQSVFRGHSTVLQTFKIQRLPAQMGTPFVSRILRRFQLIMTSEQEEQPITAKKLYSASL